MSQVYAASSNSLVYKDSQFSNLSRGSNRNEEKSGKNTGEDILLNGQFINEDDWIQVGKLHYNSKDVLGRGCEGTVVFRYVVFQVFF